MKATLKFWTLLSCAGLAVIGCNPVGPDYPNHNDENPPVERPDEPDDEEPDKSAEEPLTDGSLFTIQLNDEIMATVGTGTWNAIAYGNGKYVAVGEDGNIAYSTDGGKSWIRKQVGTNAWNDIVFNSKVGRFVAVGPNGYNGYSSDGITWTQVTIDHNYSAVGVEPNQNMFIAVRSVGSYYGLSSQGTTWSEFAKEGCDIVIVYLNEHEDANYTKEVIEYYGRKCLLIACDLRKEEASTQVINETLKTFGKVDILVNNCGVQFPQNSILDISAEQLKNTFETNIFSFFYLTKAVLPYLEANSSIINTSSITAFDGKKNLIDYSSTKGAITVFTKSLALSLADSLIRVNAVAPGPIWTPLIPASFTAEEVSIFGTETPLKRAGQPFELAPAYLYLASDDSRYVTGQIIHVNGGTIV